ncbi:MAG: 3-methyl-2-oxobutanoate hydroxymethyltransferase [Phycisphaerae bacterium]|mgnify:CR=1 FL=1|nr:3-methyl-2-oxobutanoate hydroxymethyltransferase [Phycisphaerae bacterium]
MSEHATDDVVSEGLTAPVTIRTIQRWARDGSKFACLTCYDATTARWFEKAGLPVLLVGDTAAEMILGFPATLHAPLDFMIAITAGVKRGAPKCLVMGDMPFLSYQADDAEGVRNAGRFLTEGTADCVKLEVDRSFAPLVTRMARAGIPVVAHIGSRPQHARLHGGYYAAGKTAETARLLLDDATAMEDAGAVMLLIEAAPQEVTEMIVERSRLPVIGCGAGPACHGQVVVTQDLLGLTDWQPGFARPLLNMGRHLLSVAGAWKDRVRTGQLGEHPYVMSDLELAALAEIRRSLRQASRHGNQHEG